MQHCYEKSTYDQSSNLFLQTEKLKDSLREKSEYLLILIKFSNDVIKKLYGSNLSKNLSSLKKSIFSNYLKLINDTIEKKERQMKTLQKAHDDLCLIFMNHLDICKESYEETEHFILENTVKEKNNLIKQLESIYTELSIVTSYRENIQEIYLDNEKDYLKYFNMNIKKEKLRKDGLIKYFGDSLNKKENKNLILQQVKFFDENKKKNEKIFSSVVKERNKIKENFGYNFSVKNQSFNCQIEFHIPFALFEEESDSSNSEDKFYLYDEDQINIKDRFSAKINDINSMKILKRDQKVLSDKKENRNYQQNELREISNLIQKEEKEANNKIKNLKLLKSYENKMEKHAYLLRMKIKEFERNLKRHDYKN